jgi:hypothetical protein
VRLAALDAPEADEAAGPAATATLTELLASGPLQVQPGEVAGTDRYGRTLAYVWAGSTFVNVAMIERGQAVEQFYGDNTAHRAEYLAAQAQASAAKAGVWAAKPAAPATKAAPKPAPAPKPALPVQPTPTPQPVAPAASASAGVYYTNCDAVRAAGADPLTPSDPGSRPALDRDSDGFACE